MKIKFKATRFIKEAMIAKGIKHVVILNKDDDGDITEVVRALIPIGSEGDIEVDFMSFGNDLNVCIEIKELMTGISKSKREKAIEACNCLNARYRVLKFFFYEGNVNLFYDLPKYLTKNNLQKDAIDYLERIETLWDGIRRDLVNIIEDEEQLFFNDFVEIDEDFLPL